MYYLLKDEEKYKIEVFDKIKELKTLKNTGIITSNMVADYYEVKKDTVDTIVKRNKYELEKYGLQVISGRDVRKIFNNEKINNFRGHFTICDEKFANGRNTLINILSLMFIGMRLTESDIAKQIRKRLLKVDSKLYYEMMPENTLRIKKYESEIGDYLEFSFGKENVKSQVRCGKYRLDFVLFDQYHIEVDEYGHRGYNEEKEIEREKYISENTDYITIRYNPQTEMPYMLMAKILKEMEGVEYEI